MARTKIKYSEFRKQAVCNSPELTKVVIKGTVYEWVGIGVVECGKATEEDLENYPEVIEG